MPASDSEFPTLGRPLTRSGAAPLPVDDRYELQCELGRGGMATVYLARDRRHDRRVALKVLHLELSSAVGAERFLREITIAARLQHPNILPLYDSGCATVVEGDPRPYYVMPYIEGESLRARLRRETQLDLVTALRITSEVAAALTHAHALGIVHRDIKPENILLDGDRALVADFGIATALAAAGGERLTETGLSLGTPAYMSPEQASGGRVDARADVYSLGCVLYELLAGDPPFTGATSRAILARHALDPVPSIQTARPATPARLEAVLLRALAKVPADRFASAAHLAQALTTATTGPLQPEVSVPPLGRRRPAGLILLSLGAVVMLAFGAVFVMRRRPVPAMADPRVVAVLPFGATGADPALTWLAEGLVDLISIRLMGDSTQRPSEPQAVLSAWEHARRPGSDSLTFGQVRDLARRLGAGRVITGRVAGGSSRVILSAALQSTTGRAAVRASVNGPLDSVPALVDRLVAQLFGLDAGVERDNLASLSTTSFPALRAFLAGRAQFRRGHIEEATRQLYEAVRIDSTFALAGLELKQATAWNDWDEGARLGGRVARRWRSRLSAADQALLTVTDEQWINASTMFRRWHEVLALYPDRPRLWYALGDTYFHWGALAGIDSALPLAERAFRRGWQLDSAMAFDSVAPERAPIFAEPLTHMVDLAQMAGDTAALRRLVGIGLAADTSGEQAHYLAWHLAVAGGDSARRAFWAHTRGPRGLSGRVVSFTQFTGIAAADAVPALDEDAKGATGEPASFVRGVRYAVALNAGHPAEARMLKEEEGSPDGWGLRSRVRDALYWGGDSVVAREALRRLDAAAAAPARTAEERQEQIRNRCVVAESRLTQGGVDDAGETIALLERTAAAEMSGNPGFARFAEMCAATLDALRDGTSASPSARTKLDRLDSLARTNIFEICCRNGMTGVNLVIARLAEYQGDLPRALRAVRRRTGGFGLAPYYMSTFVAEEGRLAALVGDTAAAVRAYRHYLALRPRPEPAVVPIVAQVRADLEALLTKRDFRE